MAEPSFIEKDPATVEAAALSTFETALGKTLFPAQAERLLLNALVYQELILRVGVQYAATQNLVNYAVEDKLDQLGEFTQTTRISAQAASTTLQFSVPAAVTAALTIPAGTRAISSGSSINFATTEDLIIPIGSTTIAGSAQADVTGVSGNGFAVGSITTLVDTINGATVSVTNTSTSSGGAAVETDDRYRDRIKLAPNRFSVAGSEGAYRFFTFSADSTIIDVSVVTTPPVLTIDVYPLTSSGLPDAALIAKVDTALSADDVRPLTDVVRVQAPSEVSFDITATVTRLTSSEASIVQALLDEALAAYVTEMRSNLGKDIVRSQIIAALSVEGVYKVELTAPAADVELSSSQWSNPGTTTVTLSTTTAEG